MSAMAGSDKDMLNDRGMMGDASSPAPHPACRGGCRLRGTHQRRDLLRFWWAQPIDRVIATCVERYGMLCDCLPAKLGGVGSVLRRRRGHEIIDGAHDPSVAV